MKGYIYILYVYVTMVIPINPKRSPKYGNWDGLVAITGRELTFFIYLPLPSKGCHWGRVGCAFGGLGVVGNGGKRWD